MRPTWREFWKGMGYILLSIALFILLMGACGLGIYREIRIWQWVFGG